MGFVLSETIFWLFCNIEQGTKLARLRGLRRVYLRHLESSVKDIINLIETFDYENEQNFIELNSLKNSF